MDFLSVLGISASPRKGNTEFLLDEAFKILDEISIETEAKKYSFRNKRFEPCDSCYSCLKKQGHCRISDDFEELRQLWLWADVIIYCVPVFRMLIPAKLRAFMERLGCTFYSFYEVPSVRHMKTIGVVTNGTHLYGGQELALVNLILDAVSMKCIAVAGDNPESYIGASAWTYGDWKGTALTQRSKDKDSLDPTFSISIKAARSVVQRCVEVASILKTGGIALKESLNQDPRYRPWVRKISESQ